jgi:cytochrome c-type biogenesis protein CcmE
MESAGPLKSKSPRRIRLIAGTVVIVAAVGALLWLGFGRGTVYYYSVAELLDKGGTQNARVAGQLQEASLANDGQSGYTFTIHDRDLPAATLKVVYHGALPDTFKDQADTEVVAQGDFDGFGVFLAQSLITKCPSKYEATQ